MHLADWISVEYREEVHEMIQRKVRYLSWDNRESKERWRFAADAARIESIRQEESSLQSTATWEQLQERKEGAVTFIPGTEGRTAQA